MFVASGEESIYIQKQLILKENKHTTAKYMQSKDQNMILDTYFTRFCPHSKWNNNSKK